MVSYFTTTIGVPVYLHYCGGELEQINYLVKSTNCCDGQEEDTEEENGCCEDEGLYVQNHHDFTIKTNHYQLAKACSDLLFMNPQSLQLISLQNICLPAHSLKIPSAKLDNRQVVSTTILRI